MRPSLTQTDKNRSQADKKNIALDSTFCNLNGIP